MVKAFIVDDGSEARSRAVGSCPGAAVKALRKRPVMQPLHRMKTMAKGKIVLFLDPWVASHPPVFLHCRVIPDAIRHAAELRKAESCFAEQTTAPTGSLRHFAMKQNAQPKMNATIVCVVSVVTESSKPAEHSGLESATKALAKRLTPTAMQMAAAIAMTAIA